MRRILYISLLIFIAAARANSAQDFNEAKKILIEIEDGFRNGQADKLADLVGSNTHFSFTSDLSGYFSYSQIISLLKDYFQTYKPLKFSFSSKSDESLSPFAWGEYTYLKNGIRGSHKVFVSLQKSASGYKISIISINE